jgi:2-(1,2-epoxy-1,2-dihydrophenyl)acetyl-CoA isomerase
MSDDAVELTRDGRVATLTLRQPDRLNALSEAILDDMETHLRTLESENVGCLVVEGDGRAFSAGGDIDRLKEFLDDDVPTDHVARQLEQESRRVFSRLVAFPAPTVAKIDGPAVGAGASLAVACDLLLASERATIGFVFRNVGLGPDSGVSYMLPRIVGTNVAKELVYTGRILDADEAADLGLFNHVYPTDDFESEVEALTSDIAAGPTVALRHAKRLLSSGPKKTFEEAVVDEWNAQATILDTADHREGIEAFLADREPDFAGR